MDEDEDVDVDDVEEEDDVARGFWPSTCMGEPGTWGKGKTFLYSYPTYVMNLFQASTLTAPPEFNICS